MPVACIPLIDKVTILDMTEMNNTPSQGEENTDQSNWPNPTLLSTDLFSFVLDIGDREDVPLSNHIDEFIKASAEGLGNKKISADRLSLLKRSFLDHLSFSISVKLLHTGAFELSNLDQMLPKSEFDALLFAEQYVWCDMAQKQSSEDVVQIVFALLHHAKNHQTRFKFYASSKALRELDDFAKEALDDRPEGTCKHEWQEEIIDRIECGVYNDTIHYMSREVWGETEEL